MHLTCSDTAKITLFKLHLNPEAVIRDHFRECSLMRWPPGAFLTNSANPRRAGHERKTTGSCPQASTSPPDPIVKYSLAKMMVTCNSLHYEYFLRIYNLKMCGNLRVITTGSKANFVSDSKTSNFERDWTWGSRSPLVPFLEGQKGQQHFCLSL